ncbi:transcription factor IIIB [Blastocystis sp. subtype 4]|uniref:transcription factor IIIB n=1 Tax=Blastocystis sp. subtype 4 TaxID=944170 RepID=UPI0007117D2A|nr:transcription factor IIIB [Blastocystis sp. subtype 4]KNB43911.1 transcription factor IIIB [Blastocystis sp. subtype 4]|eukprot:XP_014527354.1 transcription factor IIIB [Blastocystis sp. subtype 4]
MEAAHRKCCVLIFLTNRLVGQIVSETGSSSFMSSSGRYAYRESREVTLSNGRKRISQIAAGLNLQSMVDSAHRVFALAVNKNFTQGRRATHVCAACLYVACRFNKNPTMLIDFADLLQTDVWSLGSVYTKLNTELNLKVKPIDPSLYINRFASQMEFGDQLPAVSLTALRLTKRMQRDWIVRGRRPLGIVAAALLLAARVHGFRRTKKDILSVVKVSDETLRIRLAEFESTAASSLTLDEFNKLADQTNDFAVDERGEAVGDDGIMSSHPPAFVRNRLKDEQELQQLPNRKKLACFLAAVENGTITPGSHLQRQKKISRTNLVKQQDLESLYRELEEEMKAVLYGKSQSASQAEQPPERAVTTMNELDQTLIEPSHEAEGESHKTEDREVVKEGVTAKEAEVQQAVAGAYDAEVEEMFLSEEEQKKKMELWEAANGDWIRQQEEKRKEKEARGAKMTKRKKKVNNRTQYRHPVKTAAEGLKRLVETKKISRNVNYEAMRNLFK